jgi:hypothetical protein
VDEPDHPGRLAGNALDDLGRIVVRVVDEQDLRLGRPQRLVQTSHERLDVAGLVPRGDDDGQRRRRCLVLQRLD